MGPGTDSDRLVPRVTMDRMPKPYVFRPDDRPECEVLVDGTWFPGEVRMWTETPTGWVAEVGFNTGPAQNRIDSFPFEDVRPQGGDGDIGFGPTNPPAHMGREHGESLTMNAQEYAMKRRAAHTAKPNGGSGAGAARQPDASESDPAPREE